MKIKTAADYKQINSSVITIGTFDGVHVGHQQIIHRLVDTARKNDLQALVLTFFPTPSPSWKKLGASMQEYESGSTHIKGSMVFMVGL